MWRSGSGDGGIFTDVSVLEQASGNMPLNQFFADVRARGWTPTTTWQVDFGVETVDTNGTTQRFTFTEFDIYDQRGGDVLTGTVAFGGSPRGNERWPDEAQPRARPRRDDAGGVSPVL